MSTLSRKNDWIIRRDDAVRCTCQPVNPRHTDGWHCVTPAQFIAWRATLEDVSLDNVSDVTLLRMCWLWLNWSQDPEAKRLSGRTL